MTQDEIDALPEWPTGFGQLHTTDREGNNIAIPIAPRLVALWRKENEPHHVLDKNNILWDVGWHQGTRYKMRSLKQLTY